jgi:arylsulfatase A-like enzyme
MDGPFSPRVREGYRAFDRTVGQLSARLRARGHLERTLIAMGADHGHSPVMNHFDLEGFFERRGLRTLYYGKQVKRWFGCDAAVMVGGNAIAHVYLRGAGWMSGETGVERLAKHPGLIDDLLAEPGVDILAWNGENGTVHVRSRRGAADVRLDDGHVTYHPRGGDPFGYGELPSRMTRHEAIGYGELPSRMTRHEAIQLTQHTTYPDGIVQVAQIFGASRSGDLIVTSTPTWDLRAHGDHHLHRSGHGSLHRDHMAVPFAINHPFDTDAVRTVDAFPTILGLMGEPTPGDIDGRDLAFPDLPDSWGDPDVEAPVAALRS